MDKVQHIFFDLDRTLWDFETNSRRVISDLFTENNLESRCSVSFCEFVESFETINDMLWSKLRAGEITKQQLRSNRFFNCMVKYNYSDMDLAYKMEEEYVQRSPYQKTLFPGAIELLTELKNNNYKLHIITNGFKEVQYIKLEQSGIRHFFSEIIISEEVGFTKPDPEIFKLAMKRANTLAENSAMVGDDLHVDIKGGISAGMRTCYFNPHSKAHSEEIHYEVQALAEIKPLLVRK